MLVFGYGTVMAQDFPTDEGSIMPSGGFSFSSFGGERYEVNGQRFTSIRFSPSIRYFVIPGLAIGGLVSLGGSFQGDFSQTFWTVGPRLSYFIGGDRPPEVVRGTIYPYLGALPLFTSSTTKSRSSTGTLQESSSSGFDLVFDGGILYMLSDKVGIFGEGQFEIVSIGPEGGTATVGNIFSIFAGFTLFIGTSDFR